MDRKQENRDVVSRCLPLLALAFLGVAACAPLPVHTSLPVEVRPSPNFGERRPNYVVLHHTSNSDAARAVATLTRPASQVSAHYLVVRDGRIVYMVDERLRAWHAGEWFWGGNRDINSASIGIEIDNDGREPYTRAADHRAARPAGGSQGALEHSGREFPRAWRCRAGTQGRSQRRLALEAARGARFQLVVRSAIRARSAGGGRRAAPRGARLRRDEPAGRHRRVPAPLLRPRIYRAAHGSGAGNGAMPAAKR